MDGRLRHDNTHPLRVSHSFVCPLFTPLVIYNWLKAVMMAF